MKKIIITIELPEKAADRLLEAFKNKDEQLLELFCAEKILDIRSY